jgi:small subunit ribosomal protein S3
VKNKYKEFLKSDVLLRVFLEKKLRGMYVSNVEMERGEKILRIIIETSRPGMIIGRSGDGAVKLKNDILKFIEKNKLSSGGEVKIDIKEVKSPESNATIVAQMIADGLEKIKGVEYDKNRFEQEMIFYIEHRSSYSFN